ncbi:hypothetical protein FDP41_000900 [Naegleria fowleri]|uniref:Uncharacterized protein n=1 Tax=Naegleria fowleri TaxID=5763 RepID=A0A6A5BRE8_NAEFO|nr:uncharacterized protein FDP41_000900 [Naegleria fowleri]KAF0979747.1 hypothetical protein FDP41_000900 [Naegleria fowleri]
MMNTQTYPTETPASGAGGLKYDNRYYEREEAHHARDRFWTGFFLSLILFFTLNPLSCLPYMLGWRYRTSDVPRARKWGRLSWLMFWATLAAVTCFWICAIIVIPIAVGCTVGRRNAAAAAAAREHQQNPAVPVPPAQ